MLKNGEATSLPLRTRIFHSSPFCRFASAFVSFTWRSPARPKPYLPALSLSPPLPLLLLLSPSHSLPASTPPATPPLSSARRRKSLASAALWMSGVLPLCGGAARKVASSAHPQWWPGAHPPALAQVAMGSDVQLRIWRNEGCDMLFPYNTAYEVFFQKQGKC